VDVVGCRTILNRVISIFVFDILQIPSGCIALEAHWLLAWVSNMYLIAYWLLFIFTL
jgi:hypothetical protein